MGNVLLFLLILNTFALAQPSVISKKIIELNFPLASVNKIKKINKTEFGAIGEVIDTSGHRDIFFAKFSCDNLLFSKHYKSELSIVAQDFEITADSSFIIIGNKNLLKINNIGDTLWTKEIDELTLNSTLYSIVKTDDNNFIACGYLKETENSSIYYSIYLIKFNEHGEIIWRKAHYRESSYQTDFGIKIQMTSDNHFIISGTNGGSIFLLKTDSEGNESFFKYYHNLGDMPILLKSRYLTESSDSSYFIVGTKPTIGDWDDILFFKTDKFGDTLFVKNYNGNPIGFLGASGNEHGVYLMEIDSNSIILGGNGENLYTNDYLKIILKLDSEGNIIWKHIIESENYSKLMLTTTSDNNSLLYLGVEDFLPHKIFILTTSYDVSNISQNKIIDKNYALYQNYPNPFNPSTAISYSLVKSGFVKLKVYDLLGCEVANLVNEEQSIGKYKIEFNASNLTSGVYFYRLQSGSFTETKKLILLR